ncbi:MAG: PHP domain-containing protein [Lachnospiraceae bacterium]|nr:PHP domain-containing protein [Lachnospiraceae bacterium]
MFNISYDLHIHSCLSPCGDNAMTPANIAGMAAAKGLEAIALTDHNSSRNCGPFLAYCDAYGIIGIPGLEINTIEEVHAVCLFRTLEDALDFDSYVYDHLQKVPNNERIFGQQILMNDDEEEIGREPNLLINATDISFDEVWDLVRNRNGVMFPAHIDKDANSLTANLGFIPPGSQFKTVEIKDLKKLHKVRETHPFVNTCQVVSNSDAHYLDAIREPSLSLYVEEKSRDGIIDALLRGPFEENG